MRTFAMKGLVGAIVGTTEETRKDLIQLIAIVGNTCLQHSFE
jgi:uncharacterized membrane protein (DUF4010 family)